MREMPASKNTLVARTVVALIALAGSGCVERDRSPPPAAFPAIDATRLSGHPACPDLTGVYASAVAAGSDARLATLGGLSEPRSSAIQITYVGPSVQVATWWPPQAVRSEASALAWRDDVLYRIWWDAARGALSGMIVPGSEAVARASSVPSPTAVRMATWAPECTDGWMAYASSVHLARDVAGGLLVREEVKVRHVELPLMCGGDGCAGIPLYTRFESRWARHPPATLPAAWAMDFASLPIPAEAVRAGSGAPATPAADAGEVLLPME